MANPNVLDSSSLTNMLALVRTELGDNDCYDCSPFKILQDITIGRVQTAKDNGHINVCARRWKFLSPEND